MRKLYILILLFVFGIASVFASAPVCYEYWLDDNYSAKTSGSIAEGNTPGSIRLKLDDMTSGFHRFNYRAKNSEGYWGSVFAEYFYVAHESVALSYYEYWLDDDYTHRVKKNVGSNANVLAIKISDFDKTPGTHNFNLRTRDMYGRWSSVYRKYFVVLDTGESNPITGYRHYANETYMGAKALSVSSSEPFSFQVTLSDIENVLKQQPDSIRYTLQLKSRRGWLPPVSWNVKLEKLIARPVSISYNGRYVTLSTEEKDAEILYTLDGKDPASGMLYVDTFDAGGLGEVRALTKKKGRVDSEELKYHIQRYADEHHAETESGGLLASSYDWVEDDMIATLDSLKISGSLNDADYSFIRDMRSLEYLDLSGVRNAIIPEGALVGVPLVTAVMPSSVSKYGKGIFRGDSALCAIIWNAEIMQADSGLSEGVDNPNLLLYLPYSDTNGNSGVGNRIEKGKAESIVITDGYPFHAPLEFHAGEIRYTRHFDKETIIGTPSGWETISLPFDVQTVSDAVGETVPFARAGEDDRPFWLYRPEGNGWEETGDIKAFEPYIIAMPNNPDYIESCNIKGDVVFSATNTTVAATQQPQSCLYKDGLYLWPSFWHINADRNVLVINADWYEGYNPGSIFVAGYGDVMPFRGYLTSEYPINRVPVFDNSGVEELMSEQNLKIWIESRDICVLSRLGMKVRVYDTVGRLIKTVETKAGEPTRITGLSTGIYIIGSRKVMLR